MKALEYSRINLYTILTDLLRNLWVILLAAYVGFMGSVTYYNHIRDKQFTSSMTLSVNLSGYTSTSAANMLSRTIDIAQTLDDVFKSEAMFEIIKNDLGTSNIGTISAAQLSNTNLISVSATGDTAQAAYDTLKSVLDNYKKVTDHVFTNVVIRAVVHPSMPTAPSNRVSPYGMGIIFAFVAASIIIIIMVFVSFLRDTVKNVNEVDSDLDAKLFGVVYHVKSKRKDKTDPSQRLIITNPFAGYAFSESYRRMAIKIESLKRTKGLKVFAITSVAENEGKTTVSSNIAVALAQNNNRVLLVDCDFKNPSIHHFFPREDRPENRNFHNFIADGGDISDFLYHDTDTGLYIADSSKSCEGSSEKLSHARFGEVIAALKEQFDFVIIDTPPCGITVDAEIVSESVDAMLMVVRQDGVHVSEINDHIENFNKTYVAGCVFNDVHTLQKTTSQPSEDQSKYYYHGEV